MQNRYTGDIGDFGKLGLLRVLQESGLTIGVNWYLVPDENHNSDWNNDLSPWEAPAVFGKESFGSGASEMLGRLLGLCDDRSKTYYIGGYSLAGLFALWAAYQTDVFKGVAAASPSVWFPGFAEYMEKNEIRTDTVYLSLGDREEKARNPVMAPVGDRIREAHALLKERGVNCILEWNEGNHFKDPDLRTAKAFAWVLSSGNDSDFG